MVNKDDQLHIVVFGTEGQGGLLREVEDLSNRVSEVEAKVNVISGKWLALMTLMAIAGDFLAHLLIHH